MFARRLRFLAPTVVLASLALVAAACGGGVASAAFDVNGRETSQGDFDRELDAIADNDGFAEWYEGFGGPVRNSEGTVSAALAAEWATLVILQELMADAIADEGVEVSDEDRTEAEAGAPGLFDPSGEIGETIWAEFPQWFRDRVLDRLTAQVAYLRVLAAPPSDAEVQEFYDANVAALVEGCPSGKFVSHILVESEGEANAVFAALDDGASFDALARERSIEPGAEESAGFLDCFQEGAYVAEFSAAVTDAPVASTTAPVETEHGWHVIRVDAEPPLEAIRSQIGEALASQRFQELIDGADIDVDPRYGDWVVDDTGGARVQPPSSELEDPSEEIPDLDDLPVPELDDQGQPPPPAP